MTATGHPDSAAPPEVGRLVARLGVDAELAFAAMEGLTSFSTWRLTKRPLHPNGQPAALHVQCAVRSSSPTTSTP